MQDNPFWQYHNNFYENVDQMRKHFDKHFENPLQTNENRFCWDYWYVENQYKLIRTPADHFFGQTIYDEFKNHLISWGKANLGCNNISPMWLSYYIDGCEQQLHSDSPHGPWAFVYSLTRWDQRIFTGGETYLLKPETLAYWECFDTNHSVEKPQLIENIPAKYNQLTVFDPRFPHGVQQVRGAHDPKDARIVIHGWFTESSPCISSGPISEAELNTTLEPHLKRINKKLGALGLYSGLLSFGLHINSDGSIDSIDTLSDTLIEINASLQNNEVIELITSELASLTFIKKEKPSTLTIPFIFK